MYIGWEQIYWAKNFGTLQKCTNAIKSAILGFLKVVLQNVQYNNIMINN